MNNSMRTRTLSISLTQHIYTWLTSPSSSPKPSGVWSSATRLPSSTKRIPFSSQAFLVQYAYLPVGFSLYSKNEICPIVTMDSYRNNIVVRSIRHFIWRCSRKERRGSKVHGKPINFKNRRYSNALGPRTGSSKVSAQNYAWDLRILKYAQNNARSQMTFSFQLWSNLAAFSVIDTWGGVGCECKFFRVNYDGFTEQIDEM